jgi:flagellar export protein FliJ
MFKFRLQRVLELRAQKERDAAAAVVRAEDAASAARAERDALTTTREQLAQSGLAGSGGATVGELQNLGFLLAQLDARVAQAGTVVHAAEETVQQVQGALRTAHQDRRAFDRLRDRHHEQWRAVTEQQDRRRMDEIALTRFTQRGPLAPPSDTTER